MTENPHPLDNSNEPDIVHSWSIVFRGDYKMENGFPVFAPAISLNSSYTEWQPATHVWFPTDPVMKIQDGKPGLVDMNDEPMSGKYKAEAPWIVFDQSGISGQVSLTLPLELQKRNITQKIASTENVSLRATIRREANPDSETSGKIVDSIMADEALHILELPIESPGPSGITIDLSTCKNVRPIVYLEQSDGGFILLAEVVDSNDNRRILFSIMDVVLMADQSLHTSSQRWVVSLPYVVEGGLDYTIRVHQDGDITRPHKNTNNDSIYRYFEFWVNNLPLGIHVLPSTYFPFKQDISLVGIGYWPKEDGQLYFKGGLGEIIVDPHGLCPCSG